MKTTQEILNIVEQLDKHIADDFEGQELDFKEWNEKSNNDAVNLAVKMAVCMANGGGGMIVFGIRDKVTDRTNAVKGVPLFVDAVLLQKTIYDRTEPHITANFEWVTVPEGHGRLLLMRIFPGMPPYTETDGSGSIRVGKDCRPLTGSMRKEIMQQSGVSDFTMTVIDAPWRTLFSPVAMEKIRGIMKAENAPAALGSKTDEDLLSSIGAIKDDKFTFGGLLIVGNNEALERYIPHNGWDFRRMRSSTDYSTKDGANNAIPVALNEMERYMAVDNPATTVEYGFIHYEFSTYPKIALREALLNAFVHRDYRIPGTVMLKHYKDRLVLTNPGSFIGGVTAENILHHPPVARNPHLADLLDRLHLVNKSNLGVPRIYKSLLEEGKEPPQYREIGEFVELSLMASTIIPEFRNFMMVLNSKGMDLDIDHLIILNYLLKHREIDTYVAGQICQRNIDNIREVLSHMENNLRLIQSGGTVKKRYYSLTREMYALLQKGVDYDRDRRLDKESVKMRILSILKERNLSNHEVRQMTGLGRYQVIRLMKELEEENVKLENKGKHSFYYLDKT